MVSSRRSTRIVTGKPPKKVLFNDDENQVKIIEQALSFSAQEEDDKSKFWYTQDELKTIRSDISCNCISATTATAAAAEGASSNSKSKKDGVCTCRNERLRQHEFVTSLLQQQQEHKLMGVADPKGLFQFSRACSKMSRQRALKLGRDQAEEVKSFEESRQLTLSVVDDALELLGEGFF